MTSDLKAVIFDLDGTLLTIDRRFHKVFNDTMKKFGMKAVPRKAFLSRFHRNQLYHHPFGSARENRARTAGFWNEFLKSYGRKAYCEYSVPIRGARKAVERIGGTGVRIAVVTGRMCSPSLVRRELRSIGIDHLVDTVVTKASVRHSTTCRQATSRKAELREVLMRLRLDAKECVFVADYVDDIRSAKPLRIATVAVLSGSSPRDLMRKENPNLIVKSICDLPYLLKTKSNNDCSRDRRMRS